MYAIVSLIAGCYAYRMDPLIESGIAVRQITDATDRSEKFSMDFNGKYNDYSVKINLNKWNHKPQGF